MSEQSSTGKAFSLRLRAALADRSCTQEDLARELGISLRAVQKWVAGKTEPRGHRLVELAEFLERDPAWFFAEPEEIAA